MVAGGGTGGHVLAGVSIADEWRRVHGADARVIFVGARGGWEEKLVPRAGYPLELLKLGALNRVGLMERVRTLLRLPVALAKSVAILWKHRPVAVIGVGGYASGPVVLMASVLGFIGGWRTAILEQNSVPGLTNRILGRFVGKVFCAFPGSEGAFSGNKAIITGNPIRSTMKPMDPPPAEPFTLFAFGGSQGAMGINSLLIEALPVFEKSGRALRIVHQTGEKDYERVKAAYQGVKIDHRVEKFIYEMPEMYKQASVLVCRAGSSTLSEVAAVGRAAILVPLPTAADDHQAKNAQLFVDRDAAVLFPQGQGKGEKLAELIFALMDDRNRLRRMERNVREFYRDGAASLIVKNC